MYFFFQELMYSNDCAVKINQNVQNENLSRMLINQVYMVLYKIEKIHVSSFLLTAIVDETLRTKG